ncbi:MAG: hypothetical protein R3F59_07095 [Myxococcota bacterium]
MQDRDFDAEIRKAKNRLDKFERSATSGELVTRLRRYSPFHPFLVVRAFALFATMIMLVLAIAALVVPFVLSDVAVVVARLDAAAGIPMFAVFAVLVICFFFVAVGAHFVALVAARSAPMLPHEAREHQRLVSDLKQLEAQRAVMSRMTPRPSEPRMGRPLPTRMQ